MDSCRIMLYYPQDVIVKKDGAKQWRSSLLWMCTV